MLNVFFAISDANERGQFGRRAKRLSAEAAEWFGFLYRAEDDLATCNGGASIGGLNSSLPVTHPPRKGVSPGC
jgi:hypothetical protein